MTTWTRSFIAFSAVVALVIVGTGPVSAQLPYTGPGMNPANPPAVSPYLNLLRRGKLRVKHVEQHRRGEPADGKFGGTIEKRAPVDQPVHVLIEQVQKFLIEVRRFLHKLLSSVSRPSTHVSTSSWPMNSKRHVGLSTL